MNKLKEILSANIEVSKLNKELAEVKQDRDLQLQKLKEFEDKNKDYIESAQTADQMKAAHKAEIEKLTAEYEAKLVEKNKEVVTTKEETAKEISTVKESVAQETIALVASQGTNVVVDTTTTVEVLTPETAWLKYQSLTGNEKETFYKQNYALFESIRMNGSPKRK